MTLTNEVLLAGPRGRRACLDFAMFKWTPDSPGALLHELVFYATHRLATARGQGGVLFGPGANNPLPDPSVSDIAAALNAVPLIAATPLDVLKALEASVDFARYWQEPDGTDELLAHPDLQASLTRVAAHLAAATDPLPTGEMASDQWRVEFFHSYEYEKPVLAAAEALRLRREEEQEGERAAQRERPADPKAEWSGQWWSIPSGWLETSTRSIPHLGPIELWLVEDSDGPEAALVERIDTSSALPVFEISSGEQWAELCRRFPLDVTASRRHDWYRATGRNGNWVIPDWAQVARYYSAVHLPITTYLTWSGVPMPVTTEASSMIAGWNPDQTYWLHDIRSYPDTSTNWIRDDDTEMWRLPDGH